MRGKIRVLVVEDSLTVRKYIAEILSREPDLEVVGEAGDGRAAIELCQSLRPHVVTLDMILPVMSGLAATEYIMAYCPTPILVVSSSANRGELFKTYEALAAGALDALDKPTGDEGSDEWDRALVAAIRLVSRVKVITHPRARLATLKPVPNFVGPPRGAAAPSAAAQPPRVLGVGVSTGGPAALVQLLTGLGADFPLPILVVMHLGKTFARAFADWLDGASPLRVTYARDGEPVPPVGDARVILAPPEQHLVVRGERLALTTDPERHSCRPAVDVLFESLARELGPRCLAALLTGMGRDGAAGLASIRSAGGRTIAQDEASSVVFSMPREAIRLGGAEQILALSAIAPALSSLARDALGRDA